jgi:hypothetical protein
VPLSYSDKESVDHVQPLSADNLVNYWSAWLVGANQRFCPSFQKSSQDVLSPTYVFPFASPAKTFLQKMENGMSLERRRQVIWIVSATKWMYSCDGDPQQKLEGDPSMFSNSP